MLPRLELLLPVLPRFELLLPVLRRLELLPLRAAELLLLLPAAELLPVLRRLELLLPVLRAAELMPPGAARLHFGGAVQDVVLGGDAEADGSSGALVEVAGRLLALLLEAAEGRPPGGGCEGEEGCEALLRRLFLATQDLAILPPALHAAVDHH